MPYSVADDNTLRTPGGCRVDNGRCFSAIHYDLVCQIICWEFSDGSFYYDPARHEGRAYFDLCFTWDPGCTFNGQVQLSGPGTLVKGRPPFFDWSAYPPDYVPIGFERERWEEYFEPCNWP